MTDPICDPLKMHYFRTPVYDGEPCQCGHTVYRSDISYRHHSEDNDYKPFNPLDVLTSPWAPLVVSYIINNPPSMPDIPTTPPDFGGGQSGGAGASGDW